MNINKNIPYYLIAVGLFVFLKFASKVAGFPDLFFLLKPTNLIIEILTGSHSIFVSESGFFNPKLNILIDKSCSGFNFWLLSFLLFTYLTVKYAKKMVFKFLSIPFSIILAYVLTIFVNSSRIFVSVIIQHQSSSIFQNKQHLIHESIGIITNLSFLILAYYITEKLLIKRNSNEKLPQS